MGRCALRISTLLEILANGSNAGFRAQLSGRNDVCKLMQTAEKVFAGYPLLRRIYYEPRINGSSADST
jgi:hypothetical protein